MKMTSCPQWSNINKHGNSISERVYNKTQVRRKVRAPKIVVFSFGIVDIQLRFLHRLANVIVEYDQLTCVSKLTAGNQSIRIDTETINALS